MSDLRSLQRRIIEAELIKARLTQLRSWDYEPHAGQEEFHRATAKIRALFTGNRFGKSRAAAQDCNWWALGNHPHQKTPRPPVRIRVVGDGYDYGVNKILLPIFRQVVDPEFLHGGTWDTAYTAGSHTLLYKNGSFIEFMSYKLKDLGRGAQMFAGVALDLVWHDEHSPFDIWQENMTRLIDRRGHAIITLTPILGKTWEHSEIYEAWQEGQPGIACFTGEMTDNPYLPPEAIAEYLASVKDPQMREVRKSGVWIALGGMVYAMWDKQAHFIPFDQQRVDRCTKSVIIDPHPSKPTAVLWCGVGPRQELFAYREYRAAKRIPAICDDIRRLSEREDIRRYLIDPKWGWINQQETGKSIHETYRENRIPVEPASKDKWGRIERMREMLEVSPSTGQANFEVMKTCPRLAWEFDHKKFKPQSDAARGSDRWETIDEDDDLLVCAEYFVRSNPAYVGAKRSERSMEPVYAGSEFKRSGMGR